MCNGPNNSRVCAVKKDPRGALSFTKECTVRRARKIELLSVHTKAA